MAKELDKLTRAELGRLFPIYISEPKEEWVDLFVQEKREILSVLGEEIAIRVEHIGSTAVANLSAKPTIDILVEIPKGKDVEDKIKTLMNSGGYSHIKDQNEYMMFVKGYSPEGFKGQCYHIHMGPRDNKGLWERIYFRDYLIANPQIASEYAALKKELAVKHKYDRDAYTESKTEFIKKTTQVAVMTLRAIEK